MIIVVPGKPVAQGNHRSNGYRIYETSKGHKQWRALVTQHAAMVLHNSGRLHFVGPVVLIVDFFFLRPVSHRKKDGSLRKGKPRSKVSSPDLSKLVRCVEDALTDAGVWEDDSRVVQCLSRKQYAPEEMCRIQIEPYKSEE